MAYTLDVLLTQDSVIIQEKYVIISLGRNKIRGKMVLKYAWLYINIHNFSFFRDIKKYLCYELGNQILHKYANFQIPIFITNN